MRSLLVCAAIAVFGVAAVPGAATPPVETTISIDTVVPPDGPPTGPFTSTGGVICPSGDTIDIFNKAAGGQSGNRLQLLVLKRFTCSDGSGTFDLRIRVHLVFDPSSDVGTWNVAGGTGAYERLHGSGTLGGTPTPTGVLDTLHGGFHID